MDLIRKYATKKKIFMSSFIYSGVVTILYFLLKLIGEGAADDLTSSMSSLSAIASFITIIQIIFYLMIIGAIAITVLAAIYFFTKDKKDYVVLSELVGYGISTVLLAMAIPGMNILFKLVRAATSGDYSSLTSINYTSAMSSLETAGNCLDYFTWVIIILFIINLAVYLMVKGVIKTGFNYNLNETAGTVVGDKKIVSYDPQTGAPIYEDVSSGGSTGSGTTINVGAGVASAQSFLKSKNGKIVLGVVVLVVVAFGGYKIYDTFFNKTKIDLLENVQVEFTGYDGSGRINICRMGDVEYDKTNAEIASFVNSVTLNYDTKTDLKNGDEVTINAVYNQTMADELKLDVQGATKTIKVKGLTERYKKASEVPSKTSSAVKKLMDEEMKEDYDNRNSSYYSFKTSFVGMYYAYDADDTSSPADYCIGLYKVDYTSNYGSTPTTETYYAIAYMNGINSSYSPEVKRTIYTTNLYGSGYKKVTEESEVLGVLESNYRFSDHKITKFK